MAKNLKKPINVVRAVSLLCGWKVTDYQESKSDAGEPFAMIRISVYQDSERPYGAYWLKAVNAGNSLCLFVNPTPSSLDDQLLTGHRGLKNAFSRLSQAYHQAGGDAADKLAAVEAEVIPSGLLDPVFA